MFTSFSDYYFTEQDGFLMYTIVLYGDKKDTAIDSLFSKALAERFLVTEVNELQITRYGKSNAKEVLLIRSDCITEIDTPNVILVLKQRAKIGNVKRLNKSAHIIVGAAGSAQLLKLRQAPGNVYTCGFSSKDYITFSSREEEKAVVSLQRSVKTVGGNVCDPLELPFKIDSKTEDYSILAMAMSMLLLDSLY